MLSKLEHGLFQYRLDRLASEQQGLSLVADLLGANAVDFGRVDAGDYCTIFALYNRKIVNGTGSGLVKANLRGQVFRRGC